jgi:hypothetical protein
MITIVAVVSVANGRARLKPPAQNKTAAGLLFPAQLDFTAADSLLL